MNHAALLDLIAGESRPLAFVLVPLDSYPAFRRWLESRGADYLFVYLNHSRREPEYAVLATEADGWDGAEAIDHREALRLARLYLAIRRPDECMVSHGWRPRAPQRMAVAAMGGQRR